MKAIHLTKADFLTKVANYETNPNEWKFLGERPPQRVEVPRRTSGTD